ncbi:hypothetical protein QUA43_20390 [Microcoleus sp. N9_B4]|uniref:hypothetical protein n=1 Tax=Microcoleus sp. N9_B4 TaxID=3055386 RepID=UPI002FD6DE68
MSRRFYFTTPENPNLRIVKFLPVAKRSPHLNFSVAIAWLTRNSVPELLPQLMLNSQVPR